MQSSETDELLTQLIAQYLLGLHNPNEDSLYNELRAQRDTENLKAHILKHYISKQRVVEALDYGSWLKDRCDLHDKYTARCMGCQRACAALLVFESYQDYQREALGLAEEN